MKKITIIIIIIMKNEKKKLCRKIELGYCPDYIVRIVLQCSNCIARERAGKKNCSENCIAIQFLYCREEGLSSLNCITGIV